MNNQALDSLTSLPEETGDIRVRSKRRSFYERVLSIVPNDPTNDLRKLCHAWREFLGAKWIWLWLFHPQSNGEGGHWELTSVDASETLENYLPDSLTPVDGKSSVAELAISSEMPIFVPDVTSWERNYENQMHRVVYAESLIKMGGRALICIPLIPPQDESARDKTPTAKFSQPLKAAVCAHFANPDERTLEGRCSLKLMGQLSAHFIGNVYDAEHHRIMTAMNSMAVEFLTRNTKRRPSDDRRNYLGKVIDLIKERLKVKFVSIFYRNEAETLIYCVATNSLYDASGKPLMHEERLFRTATYAPKEGLTGKVFASGKPYFHRISQVAPRQKYKFRETPLEVTETDLAWVIYPICAPSALDSVPQKADVFGVIRCVGPEADFAQGRKRNIDPLQIQTLDFIVRMLAPVLETMASNIERERVISIIKHDLFSPLKMCRDLVKKAERRVADGRPIIEHFFPNIQFCLHTARTLAAGLDQSPTEIQEYSPKPTKMEADIIAKIKNMLTPHAFVENRMLIQFSDVKSVFPEYIIIDRDLIARAVCNLIINAIKYGDPNSTIWILARQDTAGYYLLVQNKGEGISEEDREHIFEEGYRSSVAINKKIGLGMGLPIARAIMEKHGGALRLVGSPDFTTFSMFFPADLKA